jgi:tRNA pseudouridine13 synthase
MSNVLVKYRNSDFYVSEVSVLPADLSSNKEGKSHTIIRLSKEAYTSFEAIFAIAQFFKTNASDVHCEGLKDEDGITSQTMSIKKLLNSADAIKFNDHNGNGNRWMKLSLEGYSAFPVQEKVLHGNVFTVKLRNLEQDEAHKISHFVASHSNFSFANYYDSQRFGLPGGPYITHQVGKLIAEKNWHEANRQYKMSGNFALDFPGHANDALTVKDLDVRKLNFFLSSYSSYLWNNKLSQSLSGAETMQIFDGYKIKPLLLTENQPIIQQLTAPDYKLDNKLHLTAYEKDRATVVNTKIFTSNMQPDHYHEGKQSLDLFFFLPTGSYATMLIKHLVCFNEN